MGKGGRKNDRYEGNQSSRHTLFGPFRKVHKMGKKIKVGKI